MKRKVYATRRERMTDQIIGFLAFPLVNVPLGIIFWMISQRIDSPLPTLVSALPWLVNGIVLVLAALLRPELAMGYVAFIAIAITASTALSVLFVAACFVVIPLALILGDLANWVFVLLMLVGLYGLAVFAIRVFWDWWSSHDGGST